MDTIIKLFFLNAVILTLLRLAHKPLNTPPQKKSTKTVDPPYKNRASA